MSKSSFIKNQIFFSIILIFVQFSLIYSLNPAELCYNNNSECFGPYSTSNRLNLKCVRLKCIGHYSYDCSNEFCTINKKSCEEYTDLKIMINFFLASNLSSKRTRKYKILIDRVKNCSMKQYAFKKTDVCIRSNKMQKVVIPMRSGDVVYMKNAKAMCSGYNSYECDKEYCSLNELTCIKFKQKKPDGFLMNLKLC